MCADVERLNVTHQIRWVRKPTQAQPTLHTGCLAGTDTNRQWRLMFDSGPAKPLHKPEQVFDAEISSLMPFISSSHCSFFPFLTSKWLFCAQD
jgi:hypothetical protein